jgi:hypothetical protein
MPARHRHHHSSARRKSFTITLESCSRSSGIRVHDALETVSAIDRNMHPRRRRWHHDERHSHERSPPRRKHRRSSPPLLAYRRDCVLISLPTSSVYFGKLPNPSKSRASTDDSARLARAQLLFKSAGYKLLESLAAARSGSLCPPKQSLGHFQGGFRGAHELGSRLPTGLLQNHP